MKLIISFLGLVAMLGQIEATNSTTYSCGEIVPEVIAAHVERISYFYTFPPVPPTPISIHWYLPKARQICDLQADNEELTCLVL